MKFNIQSRPISLLNFLVDNIRGSPFNAFLFYVDLTCALLEERGGLTVAHLMKLGKESAFRYHFKKSCVRSSLSRRENICIPPEVSVRLGTEPTFEINAVFLST